MTTATGRRRVALPQAHRDVEPVRRDSLSGSESLKIAALPLLSPRLAPTSRTSRIPGEIPRDLSRVSRYESAEVEVEQPESRSRSRYRRPIRSIRDEPYCLAQVAFFRRFSHSRVEKLPLRLFARSRRAYARVSLPIDRWIQHTADVIALPTMLA